MKATVQKIKIGLRPDNAWKPIDPSAWTEANIRHLLRRASWTARPVDVKGLLNAGPKGMMDYLFGRTSYPEPHPVIDEYASHVDEGLRAEFETAMTWARSEPQWKDKAAKVEQVAYRDPYARAIVIAHHDMLRAKARASGDTRLGFQQFRSRFNQQDYWSKYALEWLKTASTPRNSATEKFNLLLQNVLVVNQRSIGQGDDYLADLHNFQRVIRDNCFGDYPTLIKRMFKTKAMGRMLDILGSTKARPNENFAREVMELFTMGVDRGYDEDDIKEAARAFTGYVVDPSLNPYTLPKGRDELILDPNLHDQDKKRVFGRGRDYNGDGIVDLIFTKPEAELHLLRHLTHEYLIEGGLSDDYLKPLGAAWRKNGFNLRWLLETFLLSQIFHDPQFRGQIYKSPFQFYLGLLQDLGLQVEPSTDIVREMDFLGQRFADPPDVNGWDGGAFWMNNGTINGRRIIVERLFSGSYRRGIMTTAAGAANFVVTDDLLRQFLKSQPRTDDEIVGHFLTYFVAVDTHEAFSNPLRQHLAAATTEDAKVTALRQVILAVLQSQYYQIC